MSAGTAPSCEVDDGCLTCGDVAVALTVTAITLSGEADCIDDTGAHETIATDLIGPVTAGDRILAHARVAIARLAAAETRA